MSTRVSHKLRRVSNALVQATLGVGSVDFWSFTVAWTRGGGGGGASHVTAPRSGLQHRTLSSLGTPVQQGLCGHATPPSSRDAGIAEVM